MDDEYEYELEVGKDSQRRRKKNETKKIKGKGKTPPNTNDRKSSHMFISLLYQTLVKKLPL